MTIPFYDLSPAMTPLHDQLLNATQKTLNQSHYIMGPELEKFEAAFSNYCGAQYTIGVGNGLEALVLALKALKIGAGDEVIVPAHTFIATWLAITAVGATIVPVDIDLATYTIDTTAAEKAITKNTRVIMPVHLYGFPCNMDALMDIAAKHDLYVIEDSAQAHGASYKNRRPGALGHIAAFSFYPTKNLGALGDGGAVVTNDEKLAEQIKLLRNYGSVVKYEHIIQGTNSRLDELQAAYLNAKLPHLDKWNDQRNEAALYYNEILQGLPLQLPLVKADTQSAWHLYVVRTEKRDALLAHMLQEGVHCAVHYPKLPHKQKAYSEFLNIVHCPNSEIAESQVLSLPLWPGIDRTTQDQVADAIKKFF